MSATHRLLSSILAAFSVVAPQGRRGQRRASSRGRFSRVMGAEPLEDRSMLSAVAPANGQEYGRSTLPLVQDLSAQGTNLGQAYCSIEKGECAEDSLAFLQPPGQS